MNDLKKSVTTNVHIFALASHGVGLSGGDRIAIEFARRWSKNASIIIYCWDEGQAMWQGQGLKGENIHYRLVSLDSWKRFGFFINYLARIVAGIKIALSIIIENPSTTILYSASEFWMDSLPAFIIKERFPKINWTATWFQTAPNPFKGFAEGKRHGKRYRLNAFFYWFSQFPIKPLISHCANFVLVNNETEKKQFPKLTDREKVIVVIGAVDVKKIEAFQNKYKGFKKIYDAVYQGRFHPQKGVVELIDIWKQVVEKNPDAKLVMIGDGPLMKDVRLKIKKERLQNNIKLVGYIFDGEEKYKIFAQTKIVVHPAFYDSGGMAAAEAMAFGLPCVGFDLKSYQSYYPHGMVKVEIGDSKQFAKTIISLLQDEGLRKKIGSQAEEMIKKNWSWDKRAHETFLMLTS